MTTRSTYTAECRRSDDWWAISIPELPGVFTQARRLDRAEQTARNAIALFNDVDQNSFDVSVVAVRPDSVQADLEQYERLRTETIELAERVRRAGHDLAVRLVEDEQLTVRDAGVLLGVSYQRVAQLVRESADSR